ncbi:MAG: hypothetical protein ABL950_07985 [Nitrospira sp.]
MRHRHPLRLAPLKYRLQNHQIIRDPTRILHPTHRLLVLGSGPASAESPQTERSKGLTVEDLALGIRSAAQNIEQEIPKIGSAVGKAVTSIT